MQRRSILVLGIFLSALAMLQFATAAPETKKPLVARVAQERNLQPEDLDKILKTLGEEARKDLQEGESVVLPGLGTLRVVRVAEHKDLQEGRPVTIPAHNVVEFLPDAGLTESVNQSGIKPGVTVPAFEFNPKPQGEPRRKEPNVRNPGTRTKS